MTKIIVIEIFRLNCVTLIIAFMFSYNYRYRYRVKPIFARPWNDHDIDQLLEKYSKISI